MERFKLLIQCFIVISLLLITGWAYAATFIVDYLGDVDDGNPYTEGGGTNTLRKCIRLANETLGADTIIFSVSGTIFPTSVLPQITDDGTVIDASSQWVGTWPSGQPGITLDGTGAGVAHGLWINGANYCHIRGLFITNFGQNGTYIYGGGQGNTVGGTGEGYRNVISGNGLDGVAISYPDTDNNVISGNYIGTDVNGSAALGNSDDGVGIGLGAKSNIIGGTTDSERNIISGNNRNGVDIGDTGSNNNMVSGNYIGTDVTGTNDLGNSGDGVFIEGGPQSNIIGGTTDDERNLISGNNQRGVVIRGLGTDNNAVSGNYIGTDVTGTNDLGNSGDGVFIEEGAQSNIIGGTTNGEGNIISGNDWQGVVIISTGTNNNVVSGNYIGTDSSGTAALGNGHAGLVIGGGAQSNIIGGTTAGERNIISGNGDDGIGINGPGADNNVVSGNYIGVDVDGNPLGNTGVGVAIDTKSNTIGGTDPGEGNIIAFSSEQGVDVVGADADYNKISGNSIHDNGLRGIILRDNGNDGIPAPTISSNLLSGNTLTVYGDGAGADATVEIFQADSFESGEGMTYLGSLTAKPDGTFAGTLDVTGIGLSVDDPLVATTTHTDNNTSEFSAPEPVQDETPTEATTLEKVSGDNQSGAVGSVLPNPLVVRVLDQDSEPMEGVMVNFESSEGASVNPTQAMTNGDGLAQTILTLGVQPGEHSVTASVEGLDPVLFIATAIGGPVLVVDAGEDKTICHPNNGGSTQIGGNPTASDGTPPYSYSWIPATGLDNPNIANPTAGPTTTTTYTVTVTDSSEPPQEVSDTVTVTVHPELIADAGSDKAINLGDAVQISGSPTASGGTSPYTYAWTPSTGLDDASAANPNATPTETTTYTVTVTDANECEDSDSVIVTPGCPPLIVDAGADTAFCHPNTNNGGSTQIGGNPTASGGISPYAYSWTPTTGLDDATIANPTATPTTTTTYTVTVTDSCNPQQQESDTVTVTVHPELIADAGSDKAIWVILSK